MPCQLGRARPRADVHPGHHRRPGDQLDLQVPERLPDRVEVAAYYVVSEALANVAKHARATVIHVGAETAGPALHLRVSDDGIGGADPARGTGLVGLKDRVEALGGTIIVRSPAGAGTTLDTDLPLTPVTGPDDRAR